MHYGPRMVDATFACLQLHYLAFKLAKSTQQLERFGRLFEKDHNMQMPARDVQHCWNSTYKMLDTSINIKTQREEQAEQSISQ